MPRIVLTHPSRQHVYQTVLAAQQAGMLQRFVTSYYWGGSDGIARSLRALVGRRRHWLAQLLKRRWHPDIEPSLVTTFPHYFLAGRTAGRVLRAVSRRAVPRLDEWAELQFDRKVGRWLSRQPRPTIVHGFEGSVLETFLAARKLGARTVLDVPSAHEHGIRLSTEEGERFEGLDLERMRQRIRRERMQADYLFAPSELVRACLEENLVPAGRIIQIPLGVDPDRFRPAPRWVGVPRPFRALYAGRLNAGKGVRYLLGAWESLKLDNAELILAGPADAFGKALLTQFRGNVRWLGGISHHEMHQWFSTSDVFVFPSLSDGFGLAVCEAMAAGLPVIVTRNCGVAIRDGVDGYVLPIRDAAALACAIYHLHKHPQTRARMGASGRRLVLERYTWRHYRRRVVAAYDAIAAGLPVQAAVDQVAN